jgi:hypothetical protein
MVTSLIIAALGLVFAAWRVRMYRAPVDAGHAGAVAWPIPAPAVCVP